MHRKGVEHQFRSSTTIRSDRNQHVDCVPAAFWWWSIACALGEEDLEGTNWYECPMRGWVA